MKSENGHGTTESLPLEGLSSQVANAVGELLRAQQELEGRESAVDEREREVAQREQALERRAAEIAGRAAAVERAEAAVREHATTLEERERGIAEREAHADNLSVREQEQRNREATLLLRERELSQREAELVDISSREARLAEREQEFARERAACEEGAAALACHEAVLEARSKKLAEREEAFESVCGMLRSMTTALNEPTPENISAALDATSKAKEVRPALATASEAQAAAVTAPAVVTVPDAAPLVDAAPGDAPNIEAPEVEQHSAPDLSDLSDEELSRMRMLQQLGTASLTDILAAIRAERPVFEAYAPRKKRRLGFLK